MDSINDIKTAKPETPAPKQAPAPATTPKVWKYVGQGEGPRITNLPDDMNAYHANELPQRHIEFVRTTLPDLAGLWE